MSDKQDSIAYRQVCEVWAGTELNRTAHEIYFQTIAPGKIKTVQVIAYIQHLTSILQGRKLKQLLAIIAKGEHNTTLAVWVNLLIE